MMLIFLPLALISSLYDTNLIGMTVFFCKIRGYILRVTIMTYRWCLVAACIDRYLATSTKTYLRNLANIRLSKYISGFIVIVWCILPIHILIYSTAKNGRCSYFHSRNVKFYHNTLTLVAGGVFPVILLIIFSFLIRSNLRYRRHILHLILNKQMLSNRKRQKYDQQVFTMLLFQIVVYIITQIPWIVQRIFFTINKTRDPRLLFFTTEFILYLLPVCSFHLFTLTSRSFRKELIAFFFHL